MIQKGLFRKPNLPLETKGVPDSTGESGGNSRPEPSPNVPARLMTACPTCKAAHFSEDLKKNLHVCTCGHHFRISARERAAMLCDENTFQERDAGMVSSNALEFPDYDRKLSHARRVSGEKEAVLCGVAELDGQPLALFIMEPSFMMGSMGSMVGEKITRLFEMAADLRLPVLGCTVSGGARMQEGMLSLLQMAKISGAVKRHSDAGLLYAALLTDPTTGGVTASFAMEGDLILAEPGALIGFAGPRVIEQTTRTRLPAGFQRAEFLLEKGFVDAIVDRREQKAYIGRLLSLHREETL